MYANLKLLYVDDNPGDRRLLKEAFSGREGVDVELAEDGETLLQQLRESEHLPNLILLDWNLPGISGFDLLRELKGDPKVRAIPVIVFTSRLTPTQVSAIYRERANCIIEKPVGFDTFSELVSKIEDFWLRTTILPGRAFRVARVSA